MAAKPNPEFFCRGNHLRQEINKVGPQHLWRHTRIFIQPLSYVLKRPVFVRPRQARDDIGGKQLPVGFAQIDKSLFYCFDNLL